MRRTALLVVATLMVIPDAIAAGADAVAVHVTRAEVVFPTGVLTARSNLMVDREVAVTARVSGVIQSIDTSRGASVRKGERLATLDQREFDLDRRSAEETFKLREAEYKRYRDLRQQNLVSDAELEQRQAAYGIARVELDRTKLVIDRSIIRAPFDGIVVDQYVHVGQKVLLDDNTPLFRISALSPLIARLYVAAASFGNVRPGQKVVISLHDSPATATSGHVKFVSPVVEPSSGSFQVIVQADGDVSNLRPGMAVDVAFPNGEPLLRLPASSLVTDSETTGTVFEVVGGRATKRTISFTRSGKFLEIRSGLKAPAAVVDSPPASLRDGARIRIAR